MSLLLLFNSQAGVITVDYSLPVVFSSSITLHGLQIEFQAGTQTKTADSVLPIEYALSVSLSYTESLTQVESLSNNKIDNLLPTEYWASFKADSIGDAEFIANQREDASVNIEFVYNEITDSWGRVESTANQKADNLIEIEYKSSKTADFALPDEFIPRITNDYILPIEERAQQQIDSIPNVEIAASAAITYNIDSILPIEFLQFIHSVDSLEQIESLFSRRTDSLVPIEYLTSFKTDPSILSEFLLGNRKDIINPFEYLSNQRNDQLILAELSSSQVLDRLTLSEFISNSRLDRNIFFESGFGQRADSLLYLENLYSVNKDSIALLEFLGSQRRDSNIYIEFINSILTNDILLPIETVFGQKTDLTPVLEILHNSSNDSTVPIEWIGAKIVISDAFSPIEFRGTFNTDYNIPVELIAVNRRADSNILVATLLGVITDNLTRVETRYGIAKDYINPIEAQSRSFIDLNIPIESFVGVLRADAKALTETLFSNITADNLIRLETIYRSLKDHINPFEVLSTSIGTHSDSLIGTEFLSFFRNDLIKPVSFLANESIDLISPLEIISSGISIGAITPIEYILSTIVVQTDSGLVFEITTSLVLDTPAPVEFSQFGVPQILLSSIERLSIPRLKIRISQLPYK